MSEDELLELAPVVGLGALSADELRDVQARLDAAPATVRAAFDEQVRVTREAMASVSSATATPPPATLRERVLGAVAADTPVPDSPATDSPVTDSPAAASASGVDDPVVELRPRRRRMTYLAAAAVAAVAIGAAGWAIGYSMTEDASPANGPEQVFAADDVRTSAGDVATGTATVYYSESVDTGVLVMNSVPPPAAGTVYQMWLVGPDGPRSAGTMTDEDVLPVTTAVLPDISSATALAFTVEPPGGSATPTAPFVAELPLA